MASKWYDNGLLLAFEGGLIPGTTDLRCALVTATYTFSQAHNDMADITNECTGTGYARKELINDLAQVTSNVCEVVSDALTWTGADFGTPAGAVIYVYNAVDANARLVCFLDQNNIVTNGGDYTLKFNNADTGGRMVSFDNS